MGVVYHIARVSGREVEWKLEPRKSVRDDIVDYGAQIPHCGWRTVGIPAAGIRQRRQLNRNRKYRFSQSALSRLISQRTRTARRQPSAKRNHQRRDQFDEPPSSKHFYPHWVYGLCSIASWFVHLFQVEYTRAGSTFPSVLPTPELLGGPLPSISGHLYPGFRFHTTDVFAAVSYAQKMPLCFRL
jgi:hypothetical protein